MKDLIPFFLFAATVMAITWWLTREMDISWLRLMLRIASAVTLYLGSLWAARAQILRESIAYIFKSSHPQ